MTNEVIAATPAEQISFAVNRDFTAQLPQIRSNIDAVKSWAIACTETDRKLVLVNDADFDAAKKRCADINKIIESIDRERKEIKKAYTAPYEVFERKVKEVNKVLTDAKNNLWEQVQDAEQLQRNERETRLRDYYEAAAQKHRVLNYRGWLQVFNQKWLNKSTAENAVKKELDALVATIDNEVTAIKAMGGQNTVAMLEYYKRGAGLAETINYGNELNAIAAAQPAPQTVPQATAQAQQPAGDADDEIVTVDFRVTCTRNQLAALKTFLVERNIKYGRVPSNKEE